MPSFDHLPINTCLTLALVFAFLLIGANTATAQSGELGQDDDNDVQQWNDINLTVKMSKHIDFNAGIGTWVGNNISQLSEARISFGFTDHVTKRLSVSPGYTYVRSRNPNGTFRKEDRFVLKVGYAFPTKGFGLTHRSTIEYRVRRPRSTVRYGCNFTIDKPLPMRWLKNSKVFLTEEPYYDTGIGRFYRNRASLGISKKFSPTVAVDVYYMRQNDGIAHPGDLNILGTALKLSY